MLIRAVAWDKRAISDWGLDLGPQEAASGGTPIKIVAEDAKRRPPWNNWTTCARRSGRFWRSRFPPARPPRAAGADNSPSAAAGGGHPHAADRNPEDLGRAGQVDRPDRPPGAADGQAGLNGLGLRRHAPGRHPLRRVGERSRRRPTCRRPLQLTAVPGSDHRRVAEAAGRDAAGPGRRAGRDEEAARQQPARRRQAEAGGDSQQARQVPGRSRRR